MLYLKEKYDLDDDQLYWYEEKYVADRDGTMQEFPSEPIDAFLSSGRPFFDLKTIKEYNINNNYQEDVVWE